MLKRKTPSPPLPVSPRVRRPRGLVTEIVDALAISIREGHLKPGEKLPTEADLMETVFAHPTLSEMMHESVLGAYGRAVHF